jgi:hypothetical protein
MKQQGIIVAAILVGAFLGDRFKLPSGILMGGMVAGLVAKGVVSGTLPGGNLLSIVAQLLVAYVIVSNSDVSTIRRHPEIVPVAIGYTILLIGFCVGAAWVLNRFFHIDIRTAIYATAPGGLSGMALSAADAGAETPISIVFQLFRLILILVSTPLLSIFLSK